MQECADEVCAIWQRFVGDGGARECAEENKNYECTL
jgi:hypothetical protein